MSVWPEGPMSSDQLPDYDELTGGDGRPDRSTWGLFGEADEVGTLNLIGAGEVAAAARSSARAGSSR